MNIIKLLLNIFSKININMIFALRIVEHLHKTYTRNSLVFYFISVYYYNTHFKYSTIVRLLQAHQFNHIVLYLPDTPYKIKFLINFSYIDYNLLPYITLPHNVRFYLVHI